MSSPKNSLSLPRFKKALNRKVQTLQTSLTSTFLLVAYFALGYAVPAKAQSTAQEINLYSARHYDTDEALYKNFTQTTGIRINRIEAGDEPLLERLRTEGTGSKADVIMLVDAARLWKAEIEGLFQPVNSTLLKDRIPAHLRAKDSGNGSAWFGISSRVRIIVFNKQKVKAASVANYSDLAKAEFKGRVCTRSGTHPYMLSWIGSQIEHQGKQKAEEWARAVVANFARSPRGGDTDQIKAVASGECAVAVTNSYYLARIMRSNKPDDKALAERVGFVMPDQAGVGSHVNISGAGIARNSPNRAGALRFLEYLASAQAQTFLAEGNNEWPVVADSKVNNPALEAMGKFKRDTLAIADIGRSQVSAQRLIDTVGWR